LMVLFRRPVQGRGLLCYRQLSNQDGESAAHQDSPQA
jgi:hypothetical protein